MIDLTRTFDPQNRLHYGTSEIGASNLGGTFIVDLLLKVLKEFNFGVDNSKVYFGIGENMASEDN